MADVEETLTHKAGPLPVWVWGVALGAIVVGVMWFRGRQDYTSTIPTGDTGTDFGGADSGYDYGTSDALSGIDGAIQYDGNNNGDVTQPTLPADDTPAPIKTNAQWLARGVSFLITQGHGALGSQTALTKYLNGAKLTQTQASMVSKVIVQYGLPPQGAPTATVTPSPQSGTPTPPKVVKTHVARRYYVIGGKNDDTWAELAAMFYGTTAGGATKIRAANPTKRQPLKKGTRVVIPAGTKTTKVPATTGKSSSDTVSAKAAVVPSVVIQSAAPGSVMPNAGSSATVRSTPTVAPYVDRMV